jgi:hypothetical protein
LPSLAAVAFAFFAVSLPLPLFSVMQPFPLYLAPVRGGQNERPRKRFGSHRHVEAARPLLMPLNTLDAASSYYSRERPDRPVGY